jgi:hypothetical protein
MFYGYQGQLIVFKLASFLKIKLAIYKPQDPFWKFFVVYEIKIEIPLHNVASDSEDTSLED